MNATQAGAVSLRDNLAGSTTLTLATQSGTADALTITCGTGGTGTGAAFDIAGALVITGFETLNMVANGGLTSTAGADRTVALNIAITGSSLKW